MVERDTQLAAVLDGARCLAPADRPRYLSQVCEMLLPLQSVDDESSSTPLWLALQRASWKTNGDDAA